MFNLKKIIREEIDKTIMPDYDDLFFTSLKNNTMDGGDLSRFLQDNPKELLLNKHMVINTSLDTIIYPDKNLIPQQKKPFHIENEKVLIKDIDCLFGWCYILLDFGKHITFGYNDSGLPIETVSGSIEDGVYECDGCFAINVKDHNFTFKFI